MTPASTAMPTTAPRVVPLTPTVLSRTQSVGRSSLTDVDALLIPTARLATPAPPLTQGAQLLLAKCSLSQSRCTHPTALVAQRRAPPSDCSGRGTLTTCRAPPAPPSDCSG